MLSFNWEGGNGPFLVETSSSFEHWSNLGEPVVSTNRSVPYSGDRAFYRVIDLDPNSDLGPLAGLVQTAQGEFGDFMARHRLKSRWWFYQSKGTISKVPTTYFRQLIVHYQFLEDGRVVTVTGPLESIATITTPGNASTLTATWNRGSGPARSDLNLTLAFPYPVNTARPTAPRLSDPTYTLVCNYQTPQPTLELVNMSIGTTKTDSVQLIELAPPEPFSWLNRTYAVNDRGVRVELNYREGNYLWQGEPMMILKTWVLHEWMTPSTVTAASIPTFSTDSYFSRTLLPGHHNFIEMVLIEPAVDPGLSESTRAALANANIRYIYTFKDLALGMGPDDVRFIGFDNTIRDNL
jgi:hypothetical protein